MTDRFGCGGSRPSRGACCYGPSPPPSSIAGADGVSRWSLRSRWERVATPTRFLRSAFLFVEWGVVDAELTTSPS